MTTLTYLNGDIKLGFHIGKRKTLYDTFETMLETPLRGYQLYSSNSRSYNTPKLDTDDILEARKLLYRYNKYAVQHGSLLHNLCGSVDARGDPKFQRKLEGTCRCLVSELDLGVGLNSGVVVHVGSCKDKEFGIRTIARSLEHALSTPSAGAKQLAKALNLPPDDFISQRRVILENSAGEGSKIGANLDEIAAIYKELKPEYHDQVTVCIDTAHIFGAGQYDFGLVDEVTRFYSDFEEKVGIERLEMFHLNDSRVPFNSHKDRHENLGMGYIFGVDYGRDGTLGLAEFLKEAEERKLILVGEPPAKDKEGNPGLGGRWDYNVVKQLCPLEKNVDIC